jgi:hypothetical protein
VVTANEPAPRESQDPGRLEEAAASFEQMASDFSHMHDQPMATSTLPSIATAALGSAPTTGVAARIVSAQGMALRELLKDASTLRAAIVVAEVLGPPKGA